MAYGMVGLVYSLRVYRINESVGKTGAGGSLGDESVTIHLVLKPFFYKLNTVETLSE